MNPFLLSLAVDSGSSFFGGRKGDLASRWFVLQLRRFHGEEARKDVQRRRRVPSSDVFAFFGRRLLRRRAAAADGVLCPLVRSDTVSTAAGAGSASLRWCVR